MLKQSLESKIQLILIETEKKNIPKIKKENFHNKLEEQNILQWKMLVFISNINLLFSLQTTG